MSKLAIAGTVVLGVWASLFFLTGQSLSGPGDQRQQAEAIGREADELAQRGTRDEAAKLRRHARELLEHGEREARERSGLHRHQHRERESRELRHRLEELHAHARELERAGKREQLERVHNQMEEIKARLDDLHHDHPARHHKQGEFTEIAQRIKHIYAAANHLDRADMGELADELRRNAEKMKQELLRAREQQQRETEPQHQRRHAHDVGAALDELREEVHDLRNAVRELQERIEVDNDDDAVGETEPGDRDETRKVLQ